MTDSTPIEESNLALIGTDEDRAVKKAAAEMEVNWDGAGSKVGIEIWRIENSRANADNPAEFGIHPWPTSQYGQFHSGDSYLILQTRQDEQSDSEKYLYDIYFWIGKDSSQDEYGVAAYKAVELDDLLGDAPVQHREVQHHESDSFLNCFGRSIRYLDGGIDSGFRHIDADSEKGGGYTDPRLYLIQKQKRITRSIQIPIQGSDSRAGGLNHRDAFVLDFNDVVYTWFGDNCSPFEKSKAAEVGHNLVHSTNGHAKLVENVHDDDNQDADVVAFWDAIGCKREDIPQEGNYDISNGDDPEVQETKLYVLSDQDSFIKVEERSASKENLISDDVCLVDTGKTIFVWIGEGSSLREQSQAMVMAQKHIDVLHRGMNTCVVRVLEGQESRVDGFLEAF